MKSFHVMKLLSLQIVINTNDPAVTHRCVIVQNSQEARAVKASLSDLPSSPEVSSKKNLFEAGEAWNQSPTKPTTCKVRK